MKTRLITLIAYCCMLLIISDSTTENNKATASRIDAGKMIQECHDDPTLKSGNKKNLGHALNECLFSSISQILGKSPHDREGFNDEQIVNAFSSAEDVYNAYYKTATTSRTAGFVNGIKEAEGVLERLFIQLARIENGEEIKEIAPGNYCESSSPDHATQTPLPPISPLLHAPCLDYVNYPMLENRELFMISKMCLHEAIHEQERNLGKALQTKNVSAMWLFDGIWDIYLIVYERIDKENKHNYDLRESILEYNYFIRLLEEMRYVAKTQGAVPPDWTPPFNRCNFMQFPSRAEELEKPVPFAPYHVQCKNSSC